MITGAGISTESNIPDYRGPNGAYTTGFKPMMHQRFVSDENARKRYWGRSMLGWYTFSSCRPNLAHQALAQLEERQVVDHIITQNVDRLHQRAGSKKVLELHGTTWEVMCMSCNYRTDRDHLQETFEVLNPSVVEKVRQVQKTYSNVRALESTPGLQRPDGDIEVEIDWTQFNVPPCPSCGGVLKPDVVFFGDNVPKPRVDEAHNLVLNSERILVIGSSLMVFSAFRLAKLAEDNGIPIAVLNMGETRIDSFKGLVKLEAKIGETMTSVLKCMTI